MNSIHAFDTCLQGDAQEEAAPALHTLRDQTRNFPTSLPISVDQADPSAHLQEVSRRARSFPIFQYSRGFIRKSPKYWGYIPDSVGAAFFIGSRAS